MDNANTNTNTNHSALTNLPIHGYDAAMGLRLVKVTADQVIAEIPITETHHQPYGMVHGGVYAGLVESVCSLGAAVSAAQYGRNAVGLDNNTSFLRGVRSGVLRAIAKPLKQGKRTQIWQAEIYCNDADISENSDSADKAMVAVGKVRLLCIDSDTVIDGQKISLQHPI